MGQDRENTKEEHPIQSSAASYEWTSRHEVVIMMKDNFMPVGQFRMFLCHGSLQFVQLKAILRRVIVSFG